MLHLYESRVYGATEGLSSDDADFEAETEDLDRNRNADLYIFNQDDRQD